MPFTGPNWIKSTNGTAEHLDILSAQEEALALGKRSIHGNVTDPVLRLFERTRQSAQPRVALERAVYFTESSKQTVGQPIVLRWAKALLHTTQNISIRIFEDELIVGRPNDWFGKHDIIYPVLDGSLMLQAIDVFREAMAEGKPDAVLITVEVAWPSGAVALSGYRTAYAPDA